MSIVKFKPQRSPHVLDSRAQQTREKTLHTVQESHSAVARSRELIRKSKQVVAAAQKRREEADSLTSRRRRE